MGVVPRIVHRATGVFLLLEGSWFGPFKSDDEAYEAADDLMRAGVPDELDPEEQIRQGAKQWRRKHSC